MSVMATGMTPRRRPRSAGRPGLGAESSYATPGNGWRSAPWGLDASGKLALFVQHPCRVKLPGSTRRYPGVWFVTMIEINQTGEWRYTVRHSERATTRIVPRESVFWEKPTTAIMNLLER